MKTNDLFLFGLALAVVYLMYKQMPTGAGPTQAQFDALQAQVNGYTTRITTLETSVSGITTQLKNQDAA
ncbi:hypothetical protein [Salmonirosea aquatica]|uniref:Uncharacterized protein n=1 Tax=Salmonirosea aquatica TaxID=2654236 RepID=A0A7C9BFG4_9BACT|nr:hypothetical protein [Cytophagaceae bacterium SJW1-29]MPR37126.1 hypothetical protein [Cytophagaceae bacterium SJW1-29]